MAGHNYPLWPAPLGIYDWITLWGYFSYNLSSFFPPQIGLAAIYGLYCLIKLFFPNPIFILSNKNVKLCYKFSIQGKKKANISLQKWDYVNILGIYCFKAIEDKPEGVRYFL